MAEKLLQCRQRIFENWHWNIWKGLTLFVFPAAVFISVCLPPFALNDWRLNEFNFCFKSAVECVARISYFLHRYVGIGAKALDLLRFLKTRFIDILWYNAIIFLFDKKKIYYIKTCQWNILCFFSSYLSIWNHYGTCYLLNQILVLQMSKKKSLITAYFRSRTLISAIIFS